MTELSYTFLNYSGRLETTTLEVPRGWAMYTEAGNRRVERFAKTLHRKAVRISNSDDNQGKKQKKLKAALISFIAAWLRVDLPGAMDTAVREAVASFHDEVYMTLTDLTLVPHNVWEENNEAAYHRLTLHQ